jgi:hypothetical protein
MHTVARLHSFDRAADDAGLSEKEIDAIVTPVFLITVFSKGEKSNLTAKECGALKALTKRIAQEYRGKMTTLKRGKTA